MRRRVRCTRVTARVRPGGEVGRWVAGLPRAAWSPTWSSLGVLGRCSPRGCGLQGLLGSPGLTGGLCPRGPGTCRVHAAVCKCKHQHHSAFRELSLWPQVNGVFPRAGRGELCPLASAWDSQDGWSGGTLRMDGQDGQRRMDTAGGWGVGPPGSQNFLVGSRAFAVRTDSPFASCRSWNGSDSLGCLRGTSTLRVTLEAHRGFR